MELTKLLGSKLSQIFACRLPGFQEAILVEVKLEVFCTAYLLYTAWEYMSRSVTFWVTDSYLLSQKTQILPILSPDARRSS